MVIDGVGNMALALDPGTLHNIGVSSQDLRLHGEALHKLLGAHGVHPRTKHKVGAIGVSTSVISVYKRIRRNISVHLQ